MDASVARIDFETPMRCSRRTTVDSRRAGVAHVPIVDDTAGLGVSVLPGHR
ncbi:MAG: hypothetical protein IPF73_15580, partial [Betaproteobacteria bacterium]|nr:hypothetical protein [Betaproteobacteria bacterium]